MDTLCNSAESSVPTRTSRTRRHERRSRPSSGSAATREFGRQRRRSFTIPDCGRPTAEARSAGRDRASQGGRATHESRVESEASARGSGERAVAVPVSPLFSAARPPCEAGVVPKKRISEYVWNGIAELGSNRSHDARRSELDARTRDLSERPDRGRQRSDEESLPRVGPSRSSLFRDARGPERRGWLQEGPRAAGHPVGEVGASADDCFLRLANAKLMIAMATHRSPGAPSPARSLCHASDRPRPDPL